MGHYRRIDKRTARKVWLAGKPLVICAVNLAPFGGWTHGMTIDSRQYIAEGWSFDQLVGSFEGYNCNYEAGYYAAYYVTD